MLSFTEVTVDDKRFVECIDSILRLSFHPKTWKSQHIDKIKELVRLACPEREFRTSELQDKMLNDMEFRENLFPALKIYLEIEFGKTFYIPKDQDTR